MNAAFNQAESTRVIESVVAEHVEEMNYLWLHRNVLVRSARHRLRDLSGHDTRLAAHVDGLRVAGRVGKQACDPQVAIDRHGAMFAAVVLALEQRGVQEIEKLVSLAEEVPALEPALNSAFGWVSARFLQGTATELLAAVSSFYRRVGIYACIMHGVAPGKALGAVFRNPDPMLRGRALQAAGELGQKELVTACADAMNDEDPQCRYWAARSSLLLGERNRSVATLIQSGSDALQRSGAFELALQATSLDAAHSLLRNLAVDAAQLRWLIEGSGIVGDPAYIPWLIDQMRDANVARLASQALGLITGADLALQDLEKPPPQDFESGPNDNPEDENVDMDPDEGLPWPDAEKIEKWWAANASRFQKGTRYFMGAPVTREHCIDVLKTGYQRKRILAAHYLCLLEPGTPLFNTSAPAWRQQRLLARM